jgi:fructose-1,6-bisphosphatase/inositol monophosphatase family enzyme
VGLTRAFVAALWVLSAQIGSGALDLAFVACGRFDAVYSGVAGEGWKPWDYAAGLILAQEVSSRACACGAAPVSFAALRGAICLSARWCTRHAALV